MAEYRVIVIGASAGGIEALCELLKGLAPDLPAAILIVQHIGRVSILPQILARCDDQNIAAAKDGEQIQPGRLYVAPADHHLLLRDSRIELSKGPRENLHRPCIDVLFRSAARAFGSRVVGVVLSGARDDGAAGLYAIKAKGGLAVVQDPKDAQVPEMPTNAMRAVRADYCLPLAQMASLLAELAKDPTMKPKSNKRSKVKTPKVKAEKELHPPFVCPECDGPLTEFQEGPLMEFRCEIGHRFTLDGLSDAHAEALERALWVAVRNLQARVPIHEQMADKCKKEKQLERMKHYQESAAQARKDLELLQDIARRI